MVIDIFIYFNIHRFIYGTYSFTLWNTFSTRGWSQRELSPGWCLSRQFLIRVLSDWYRGVILIGAYLRGSVVAFRERERKTGFPGCIKLSINLSLVRRVHTFGIMRQYRLRVSIRESTCTRRLVNAVIYGRYNAVNCHKRKSR